MSDIIRKMRIRLRKLEVEYRKTTNPIKEIIEDMKKTKKLSFGKVKKTPSKSKGLRIDPLLNRKRSFWDYVLDDFDWRSVSTPREAIAEQQRLNNFQQIPWAIECLQCFGFFVCFDTLLYVVFKLVFCFTILSCHSNDKNITRVSHSYDKKKITRKINARLIRKLEHQHSASSHVDVRVVLALIKLMLVLDLAISSIVGSSTFMWDEDTCTTSFEGFF